MLFKMTENTFYQKKDVFQVEKIKYEQVIDVKDKLMQQMNGIMMAFEASKQQKVERLAVYMRD